MAIATGESGTEMTRDIDARARIRAEREELYAHLVRMEKFLDRQFSLFGIRVGWDSIIGLIPGIGDTITAGFSAYLIWRAHQLGAGPLLKARMAGNVAIDYVIGLIPLAGDVADAMFRSNARNVRLLRRHLETTDSSGMRG